mmetsp:Transcript_16420/g.52237  ORF Transcript_16420/g.52237 Transcript_16420/m.52237 type:complete len:238 (+) Transcript_16420:883-1596(+)
MQHGDCRRQRQQIWVGVKEHSLELVRLSLGRRPKRLLHLPRLRHLQLDLPLEEPHGTVRHLQSDVADRVVQLHHVLTQQPEVIGIEGGEVVAGPRVDDHGSLDCVGELAHWEALEVMDQVQRQGGLPVVDHLVLLRCLRLPLRLDSLITHCCCSIRQDVIPQQALHLRARLLHHVPSDGVTPVDHPVIVVAVVARVGRHALPRHVHVDIGGPVAQQLLVHGQRDRLAALIVLFPVVT